MPPTFFDNLVVDPVELIKHKVKGIKKLGEILDVYTGAFEHLKCEATKHWIKKRVRQLARYTRKKEYHMLGSCHANVFNENSMSYLRVLLLLKEFGVDTQMYYKELLKVLPRMDAHLAQRGPWQRAMFAQYYTYFKLPLPKVLTHLGPPLAKGEILERRPASAYTLEATYQLTHEIFVAFNYAKQKQQTILNIEDIEWCKKIIPILAKRFIGTNDIDIVAELLSCMTYLRMHNFPIYQEVVAWLLEKQNTDGTWGAYEKFRPMYGKWIAQQGYLHTSMVAVRALMEVYEGGWENEPLQTPSECNRRPTHHESVK